MGKPLRVNRVRRRNFNGVDRLGPMAFHSRQRPYGVADLLPLLKLLRGQASLAAAGLWLIWEKISHGSHEIKRPVLAEIP